MDIFDREFKRIGLTVDQRIPPNAKIVDDKKVLELNQFNHADQQLVTTEDENLHVKFEPRSLLFSDGTRLGSAN